MTQMRQIAAMRAWWPTQRARSSPGRSKSNFREGLSGWSTSSPRTVAGRARRTPHCAADSGYLTRRLVDVSQDVIIREEDCQTDRGLTKAIAAEGKNGKLAAARNVETAVYSARWPPTW